MATTAAAITWTKGLTGRFAILRGHKVSRLSCGAVVVERVDSTDLPTEIVGVFESVEEVLVRIGVCPRCGGHTQPGWRIDPDYQCPPRKASQRRA